MKNNLLFACLVLFIVSLSSCGSSPYKKRKGCNGQGGWYNNRNLSIQDTNQEAAQQYVWKLHENQAAEF